MDKIETDIPVYSKARNKFEKCDYRESETCKLFFYTFDNASDILHHCGSCKVNTKEPSTVRDDVRSC